MKNVAPLKDALISVRLSTDLKDRIIKVQSRTRVPVSVLATESMEAMCRYYENTGELRIPFEFIPSAMLKAMNDAHDHPSKH